MKAQKIMYLFTRTPLHVGAGNSVGVVDAPLQRERHTKIPVIPGSSLKGVLADLWNDDENTEVIEKTNDKDEVIKKYRKRKPESDITKLFGNDDADNASAGDLLIGEARVLAFPVRSAKGAFAWITCPLVLSRFKRDGGKGIDNLQSIDGLADDQCCSSEDVLINNETVILEEYKFTSKKNSDKIISFELFEDLINDEVWKTVSNRLVIVNDEIFSYFCEHACEVVTRIKVNDETGVVEEGALFNQEQVPSETMFYAVIGAQKNGKNIETLNDKLKENGNLIQVGGDETVGLGYCSVSISDTESNDKDNKNVTPEGVTTN